MRFQVRFLEEQAILYFYATFPIPRNAKEAFL
jgi:hypothetical protein